MISSHEIVEQVVHSLEVNELQNERFQKLRSNITSMPLETL